MSRKNYINSQLTPSVINLDKQMIKMPSIIGKHVQKMNDQVYQSIENIITLYWHTIWDPRLLAKKDGQEEHILSFLSGFNGIVAKKLMDKIDEYDLIGEIKADIISSSSAFIKTVSEEEDDEEEISLFSWLNNSMMDLFTSATHALSRSSATGSLSSKSKLATNLETDFLREYLSDIRTSLLMELHIQFMDFFTRIQTDIVDQLSIYYDEEL
jgi:HPt (histidine-containing phosphotransfer) domain-containing protein